MLGRSKRKDVDHPVSRPSWRGTSFETKGAAALVGVVFLGVAGFFAAAGLTGVVDPAADASSESVVLAETVTIETVVVRRVPVVRRVTLRSGVLGKRVELVTVTTPVRIERRIVPVVRRYRVTVPGKRRTVVEIRDGKTRTNVVTSDRIVFRERVVTNQQVQTLDRTVDRPVTTTRLVTEKVSVTQTLRSTETIRSTDTIRSTETIRSTQTVQVTETSPPVTVTVEQPVTVTVTLPPPPPAP